MELGGKSPIVIFDDADVDNAVSGAILGNFYSTGKVCSNGTRVFVQKGIKDAFLKRMAERLEEKVVMGDPQDPDTNFGPMVSDTQRKIVQGYIEKGKTEGARLVTAAGRRTAMDSLSNRRYLQMSQTT